MPRAFSDNLAAVLSDGIHADTLRLTLSDGTVKQISHEDLDRYLPGAWRADFGEVAYTTGGGAESCGVGQASFTLGAETDRVEVKIQNVDELIGADVVSATRKLAYAYAQIGKFLQNSLETESVVIFDGMVAGAQTDERTATLSIISDRVAAGQSVGVKTLSPRHGWIFNETSLPTPPTGTGDGGRETRDRCFTGDTLIWTPRGDVPIKTLVEAFERGERRRVFCFDPKTRLICETEVAQVFRHFAPRSSILDYRFEHGELSVTAEHNIETVQGKRAAGELCADVPVMAIDRNLSALRPSRLTGFEWRASVASVEVFNFEAARWHTYFANGCAVYNRKANVDVILF